jgi:hypothetical protein
MKRALCLSVLLVGGLARQLEPSADVPWAVLYGCVDDPRMGGNAHSDLEQDGPPPSECQEAVQAIVAGTDADRERLWFLFDTLADGSPLAENVLDALLDWHVQRALTSVRTAGVPADVPLFATGSVPSPDVEMPDFLRDAPVDLQESWRTYALALQAHQQAGRARDANDAIGFQSSQPAFRRTVAGLLRGSLSGGDAVRELSR